jgi:bacterioferritin-associated ferredoxin
MNSPALKITSDTDTESVDISVSLAARDELRLRLKITNGEVVESHLSGIGCTELLEQIVAWRPFFKGPLGQLPLPEGPGHAQVMLRELILKAQGRWNFPYKEEELCHCRAVPTKKVDDAIIGGCHTVDAVKRATSASTSCGTCRPDIENILSYRLGSKI